MAIERVTFRDVLRIREFRVLWLADAQSMAGDQLARVALSVLVFQRTASSAITALTYSLTFLPAILGGALLSGLADRLPRRKVMIACDVLRATLLAVMAVPAMSLPVLATLLVLVVLVESPFSAAESSLMFDIVAGERYTVGSGLRSITGQIAQLAGFAGGGIAIALVGARAGLAVDAMTFAVSALLISLWIRPRPATSRGDGGSDSRYLAGIIAGVALVLRDARLRVLLGLAWLAGVYAIPEGLAAPYATSLGRGASAVGFLLAANPTGVAIGTYLFVRFVPHKHRPRWIGPLAILAGVPLLLCILRPGLGASVAIWAASGLGLADQIQVVTEYVQAVPTQHRGQAVGVAASGLLASQGLGILAGGILAGYWGPAAVISLAGAVGVALAVCLAASWARILHVRNEKHDHRAAEHA